MRRRETPTAIVEAGKHRAARHGNAASGKLALCGQRDLVGADARIHIEHEPAAAPPRKRCIDAAYAVLDLALRRQPSDEQRAIGEPDRSARARKARMAFTDQPRGVDIRACNPQRCLTAKARVAGLERDIQALTTATRCQRDSAVEPAPGEGERSVGAAIDQRQPAGDIRFGYAHALDRNPGRPTLGRQQRQLSGEGPEERLALGIDRKAFLAWRDCQANILEPGRGAGKDQRGAGPGIGHAGFDGEGAVIDMRAAARHLGGAISDAAVEREAQLAGIDAQTVEVERRIAAYRDTAAHADRCSGEIGQRGIGDRRDPRVEIGRQPPGCPRCQHEVDHGGSAQRTDIVERKPLRADRTAQLVTAARQIAAQRKVGRSAGEGYAQIVGKQRRTAEHQSAAAHAVDQSRIDPGIAAGDLCDRDIER